ncbi:MAG TPA: hypothetical protein VGB07_32645 [Blastocatellia bacterium]
MFGQIDRFKHWQSSESLLLCGFSALVGANGRSAILLIASKQGRSLFYELSHFPCQWTVRFGEQHSEFLETVLSIPLSAAAIGRRKSTTQLDVQTVYAFPVAGFAYARLH